MFDWEHLRSALPGFYGRMIRPFFSLCRGREFDPETFRPARHGGSSFVVLGFGAMEVLIFLKVDRWMPSEPELDGKLVE